MIDAHIHLEQYFEIDRQIETWKENGVQGVVAVSIDLRSSYRTLELQRKYPEFVYAAIGFHPEYPLPNPPDFEEWQTLLKTERHRIIAVGEIGLPHYNLEKLQAPLEAYLDFLSNCLVIANAEQLPVILHAVHDKAEVVCSLLQEKQITNAHFHWLKATQDVLETILQLGYFVSVTPEVCYRERDQKLALQTPLQQLLIETDGPWNFDGPFQHLDTSPLLLDPIIQTLSRLKGQDYEKIRDITLHNTKRCYRLN
ncbi:TatD family hydrolase [Bacillus salitolerans]|uniref:TatD family hydrolase n=1 Tax=Bacillus salitolerans TaxID=1437434 RepID=A0ABW4LSK2_9BACI